MWWPPGISWSLRPWPTPLPIVFQASRWEYLGADGHLVALREGDLAFVHVHSEASAAPGSIRFAATLPSPGRYRLFLQFADNGGVRTVAHTVEARD